MNLEFEIVGTHEGDNHALPKIKKTKAQHWTKEAQRYVAWKRHVQTAFTDSVKGKNFEQSDAQRLVQISPYPPEITGRKQITITPAAYCHMEIFICFKNRKHADPENIFGSIADALFHNDARLRGSFDFSENEPKARVKVRIAIASEEEMKQKNNASGTI